MGRQGRLRHIHKYERRYIGKKGKTIVLACADPDCNHYLPHLGLALGKRTLCWTCNEEMLLDEHSVQQGRPTCIACVERQRQKEASHEETLDERLARYLDAADVPPRKTS